MAELPGRSILRKTRKAPIEPVIVVCDTLWCVGVNAMYQLGNTLSKGQML